ncbi:MAG: TOMM precursor leader peptide-binding protein, partial [Anaerolineae bacterium]|nr:TOMM precursor leader peptide-binding protein [Anaerolineae bacterium]
MTTLIQNPQVKDCLHVEVLANEKVFLLSENASWLLGGKTYPHLVPLLTGEHTAGELVQKLAGVASPAEVHYALHQLAASGYVVEAERDEVAPHTASQTAFWHALGVDAKTARQRLAQTCVRITCLGFDQPSYFQTALSELGVITASHDEGTSDIKMFEVVLVDDYMQPELAEINQRHVRENTPWMMVKLIGQQAWIGPIFRPGVTGCWECLSQRLKPNRQLETYIQSKTGQTASLPTSRAYLPSTVAMGAQWAATEVLKWILQGKNPALEGQIITLDTATARTHKHVLVRRPQCAACGDPVAHKQPRAITLASSKKRHSNDGGHRTITPDETYQRYAHLISPITGVVTWMQDITEDGKGLAYSYIAGHNFANVQNNVRWLQDNLRSRAGGKGMSDIQAKVSAIGESIERYSGVYRGDEYVARGSLRSLGQTAIHINDVLCISDKQYANRFVWNKQQNLDQFHLVPEPFNPNLEIDWNPLWSLTNHEFKWLPSALCYYGHPECRKYFFCMADSNGASAGNTME